MLFSQSIPPSPSTTVSKICFLCLVSFAPLYIRSLTPSFWIPYICANIMFVFLISLWIAGSGRREWQPTPELWPRESCGQRSLVGCCPQGHTESDTTEAT